MNDRARIEKEIRRSVGRLDSLRAKAKAEEQLRNSLLREGLASGFSQLELAELSGLSLASVKAITPGAARLRERKDGKR